MLREGRLELPALLSRVLMARHLCLPLRSRDSRAGIEPLRVSLAPCPVRSIRSSATRVARCAGGSTHAGAVSSGFGPAGGDEASSCFPLVDLRNRPLRATEKPQAPGIPGACGRCRVASGSGGYGLRRCRRQASPRSPAPRRIKVAGSGTPVDPPPQVAQPSVFSPDTATPNRLPEPVPVSIV